MVIADAGAAAVDSGVFLQARSLTSNTFGINNLTQTDASGNSYLPTTFGIPTGGTWTEVDTQIGDSMQRVWFDVATTVGDVAPVVDETQHRWDAAIAGFRTR